MFKWRFHLFQLRQNIKQTIDIPGKRKGTADTLRYVNEERLACVEMGPPWRPS